MMEDKQGELQTVENVIAVQSETGHLLKMAIDKDLDVDKLEKLIELKVKEEERQCKKDFDSHFAEMQKEFEPIDKTKEAYSSKYAPLPLMVKKYSPIISKHGFSFKWRESAIENGKRVTIIINGWGHEDATTYFDIPPLKSTGSQNAAQVVASMSTYGNRYTFKSGFGITEIDEDDDAASLTFEDGVKYAAIVQQINDCQTMKELGELWTTFWKDDDYDLEDKRRVGYIKDKKKKELAK